MRTIRYVIPTYGYIPKIIDFGFSYIQDMENKPIWSSLAHTDVGFMTCLHDPIADVKLFLITVSNEMKRFRDDKCIVKFRNIVRNIFTELDVDWESGWDTNTSTSATDIITLQIEEIPTESKIFKKYNYYCIDIIQSLITLPLKQKSSDNLKVSYKMLANEFVQIEEQINNSFLSLYILKNIVSIVGELSTDYYDKAKRSNVIRSFKSQTIQIINSIANFCMPKLNYEKLFCGLLSFANCMQGILYTSINARMKEKNEQYEKIELKSPVHILGAIEANIPDSYTFTEHSEIVVLDCIKCTNYTIKLSEEDTVKVNKIHPLLRGTYIYKTL